MRAMPKEEREKGMHRSDCWVESVDLLSLANRGGGLRDLDLNHGNRSCTKRQAPREASEKQL